MKTNVWTSVACLALMAGAAFAQESLISHERYVGTKQGIEQLTPEQRAKFDAEKSRLLTEIGRGPDGQLLASAKSEDVAVKSETKIRHHRHHAKKAKTSLAHVKQSKIEKIASSPAKVARSSSILGAPVVEKKTVIKKEKKTVIKKTEIKK